MSVLLELEKSDVLADMLDAVRLRGRIFCRGEFAAPWALGFSAGQISHFHVIERGQCWLRFDGETTPSKIGADYVVVIPRETCYKHSGDLDTSAVPLSQIIGNSHGGAHAVLRL